MTSADKRRIVYIMTNNVAWGKTSWLALIAAIGQFAAALVIYLFAPDDQKVGATAPLLTAASTLYALIKGRMDQASSAASRTILEPVKLSAGVVRSDPGGEYPDDDLVDGARALGGPDDPVHLDEDLLDPRHEERDLHDGERV